MSLTIDSSYKFVVDGITGDATAGLTTNFDYQMPASWGLFGFAFIQNNAVFGDYIGIDIIDKNNVLGFGANFILASPVTKAYVDPSNTLIQFSSDYARTIPAGVFVRIKYTSTGLLTDVDVAVNFRFVNQN